MTVGQFLGFSAWVLVAAMLMVCMYWVIPVLSRIRYTTRVEELRDQAVDMVLDGELPKNDPAVREFIAVQEAFGRGVSHLTIARLVIYNETFDRMGVPPYRRPSRDRLSAKQKRALHELERESQVALARHLIWGSPLGYLGYAVYRSTKALKRARPMEEVPPSPEAMAKTTYVHCREEVRAKGVKKTEPVPAGQSALALI